MTERKPPGISFETWIERQVRLAQARGEFDGLPGHGKPIPDIDKPYDEQWWVRRKLREENVSYLPPSLALRKEAEVALEAAQRAPTEAHARRIVEELNTKIRAAIRLPLAGPPLNLFPYDVEQVLADRRAARAGDGNAGDRAAGPGDPGTGGGVTATGPGTPEAGADQRKGGATRSEEAPPRSGEGPAVSGEAAVDPGDAGAGRRRGGLRRRRRGPRGRGAGDAASGQPGG